MSHEIQPDFTGMFTKFKMTEETSRLSMQVSPLFFAYLQNKIAEYAAASVENKLPYNPDPTRQVEAILEHERLKNYVAAYAELMAELTQAAADSNPNQSE